VKRDCNEDHWISEVAIPVNFPHCFLRLWIFKTVFKGRIFFKQLKCALFRGLDPCSRKFLVVPLWSIMQSFSNAHLLWTCFALLGSEHEIRWISSRLCCMGYDSVLLLLRIVLLTFAFKVYHKLRWQIFYPHRASSLISSYECCLVFYQIIHPSFWVILMIFPCFQAINSA